VISRKIELRSLHLMTLTSKEAKERIVGLAALRPYKRCALGNLMIIPGGGSKEYSIV